MLRPQRPSCLLTIVFGALLLPASDGVAQTQGFIPVVGAVARAEATNDEISIQFTNNRSVPIEAWSLFLRFETVYSARDGIEIRSDYYRVDTAEGSGERRVGPIEPGETRLIKYRAKGLLRLHSVSVRAALFRDLHFEGEPMVGREILQRREVDAVDFDDWIQALDEALKLSPNGARQRLSANLIERRGRRQAEKWTRPAGIDGSMQQVYDSAEGRVNDLPLVLAALRSQFVRHRALALRHR